MNNKYQAVIKGNTIRWIDIPSKEINSGKEIPVYITIQNDSPGNVNGKRMAEALNGLSKLKHGISSIDDPILWQKELRKDRDLY